MQKLPHLDFWQGIATSYCGHVDAALFGCKSVHQSFPLTRIIVMLYQAKPTSLSTSQRGAAMFYTADVTIERRVDKSLMGMPRERLNK